ncbi:MAG: hypothetical protein CMF96_07885 [Candidatus Marinimicrobia bacterium]|nr:hypothetical protein [Candidatus Neomarinimicrobiota bacterium]|tara:strand:+ start:2716 stop:3384 length:669 start_codon:yes stop_codon:yes gene_type:complete
MLENKSLIIDFDSTFIKVETIDELAKIILKNDPKKDFKLKLIEDITNSAMNGDIDFSIALQKRLKILSFKKQDVINITKDISLLVSKSFQRNIEFIRSISENIWIVSGGFKDVITPIVNEFGIRAERVLANEFIYEGEKVIGCNENNPLFKDKGKILAIENSKIDGLKIMVGDGFTDYEVFKNGTSDYFIYYYENIKREKVSSLTHFKAKSFEELIKIVNEL